MKGQSNELTNGELSQLVKHYKIKNYHGAYIDDRMPLKLKNGYYIINLNGRSHWTVLLKDGKSFYYFDSYGFPASQEVEDQIGEYIYSDLQLQHLNSSSCGWFCLAWMKWMQEHNKEKYNSQREFFRRQFSVYGRYSLIIIN